MANSTPTSRLFDMVKLLWSSPPPPPPSQIVTSSTHTVSLTSGAQSASSGRKLSPPRIDQSFISSTPITTPISRKRDRSSGEIRSPPQPTTNGNAVVSQNGSEQVGPICVESDASYAILTPVTRDTGDHTVNGLAQGGSIQPENRKKRRVIAKNDDSDIAIEDQGAPPKEHTTITVSSHDDVVDNRSNAETTDEHNGSFLGTLFSPVYKLTKLFSFNGKAKQYNKDSADSRYFKCTQCRSFCRNAHVPTPG